MVGHFTVTITTNQLSSTLFCQVISFSVPIILDSQLVMIFTNFLQITVDNLATHNGGAIGLYQNHSVFMQGCEFSSKIATRVQSHNFTNMMLFCLE